MNNENLIFKENKAFFKEFLRKTDQKQKIINCLIKNYSKNAKKIKILSIGAGSGEDIIGFLKHLKTKKVDFDLVYLDPSEELFHDFREEMKKHGMLKNISLGFLKNFESFDAKNNKFDLIIASHVFYYLKNWKLILKKIFKILNDYGKIFIFMQSKESDNFKFRNKALKYLSGKNYKEKSADELIKVIKQMKLPYLSKKISSRLDVTEATGDQGMSSSGKNLISFLIRKKFDTLKFDEQRKIFGYLKDGSKKRGSSRALNLEDKCIILCK